MNDKLTENDVISAVVSFLQKRGFTDIKTKNTSQTGTDIEAIFPDGRTRLYGEAKGETSSKEGTPRYGIGFDTSQKEDHLGVALLWACQELSEKRDYPFRIGIALPDDEKDHELIEGIEPVLKKLEIVAFLVERDRSIILKGVPISPK